MPYVKRPTRGSKGYYPKKRAKRIYPRIKTWPAISETKPLGFAGYKAGMSHAIMIDTNPNTKTKGQQISRSVTILECPPLSVFGFRIYSGNKSSFDVLSHNLNKNLSRKMNIPRNPKSLEEQYKKLHAVKVISNVFLLCHTNPNFKKKPEIFEVALGGEKEKKLEFAKNIIGKDLKVSEIFKQGDFIDIISVTKGKGVQGPVKRFGVRILGRKFSQMHRHTGSLGQTEPGKIRHTVPAAGQLGFQTRTELNKRILMITDGAKVNPSGGFINYGNVSNDALVIDGSVAGSKKRLVRLRFAIRHLKSKYPVEMKQISLQSKQGV